MNQGAQGYGNKDPVEPTPRSTRHGALRGQARCLPIKELTVRIIQIMPAVDWYFKHDATVWNVAAFGLTDEGQTIGMVGGQRWYAKNCPD